MRRLLPVLAALAATPALAHHPLDGAPMTTFAEGLLSGVGHPMLGFDHLFFVVAVGVAAAMSGARLIAPLAFVAAMAAGVGLTVAGMTPPLVEPFVAISLLALGGAIAAGVAFGPRALALAAAGFGLFHGAAFGGSLAGVEGQAAASVAGGYLFGLAATQGAIAVAAGFLATSGLGAAAATDMRARLTGAAVAGAGALLCLEAVEGAAFAALGLG